jgi:hypothetical protein
LSEQLIEGVEGRNLGGFLVTQKMTEGGFGEVYRAEQTQLGCFRPSRR